MALSSSASRPDVSRAPSAVDLRIWPASLDVLHRTLEAVATRPDSTAASLAKLSGLGESTVAKALSTLTAIGLVHSNGRGGFVSVDPKVKRGVSFDAFKQFLRKALVSYRPFETVAEGLALGESIEVAIRKAGSLLNIKDADLARFQTLKKWGLDVELLERRGTDIALTSRVVPANGPASMFLKPEDVESEAKARLYIATRIGRDAYNALDEKDRVLLADSLLVVSNDPADAVEKAGQCVENHLREICVAQGLGSEAGKLNGGGQLASLLVGKALIHSHQAKLVDAVSTFRNAKAHHKDKRTLVPWSITEDGAIASVFSAITAIKSIHVYMKNGTQTL